jgi:hypothetical protein
MSDSLFGDLDDFTLWKKEWVGMPEFVQEDVNSFADIEVFFDDCFDSKGKMIKNRSIMVHFENNDDIHSFRDLVNINGITFETKRIKYSKSVEEFSKLLNQNITEKTLSIWHPRYDREKPSNFLYTKGGQETKYPFYIISKGRWDRGTTRKAFEKLGIPYKIIVEQEELDKYAQFVDPSNLLMLPKKYLSNYDTFSKLGEENGPGPGAARNFAWEHSISIGAKRH